MGKERCRALAKSLAPFSPDLIFSSFEPKAIETAQILSKEISLPFEAMKGLHEHDRTGVGFTEKTVFEVQIEGFFNHPNQLVFGQETAREALERFSGALTKLEVEHPFENLIVVTHGTVITLFVQEFNSIDAFAFWKNLHLPSFVVLSRQQHKILLVTESVT